MMTSIRHFLADDNGAATVDWVVLTAAIVTLGLATMSQISDAMETAGTRLADQLSGMPIRASFAEWETLRTELGTETIGQGGDGGDPQPDADPPADG